MSRNVALSSLVLMLYCQGVLGAFALHIDPPISRFSMNGTYVTATCAAKYQCNSRTQNVIECSCHPHCYLFDNCCQNLRPANIDRVTLKPSLYACAAISDVTAESLQSFSSLQLTAIADFDSVYVINKCPESYQRVSTIRLCEHPLSERENGTLSAPVSDARYSGATYRNAYCALCHNVDDFVTWNAFGACSGPPPGSSAQSCSTGFVPPSDLASQLHYCQQGTVQSCPDGGGSAELTARLGCSSGATQYAYDGFNKAVYRNWNCTLCYHPPTPEWECSRRWGRIFTGVASSDVASEPLPAARDYRCPGSLSSAMTDAERRFWAANCPKMCAAAAAAGTADGRRK